MDNIKKTRLKIILPGILVFVLVILPGPYGFSDEGGVLKVIKKAVTPFDNTKVASATSITLPKNVIRVNEPYQGGVFQTETRKDKMERFKCSQCHNNKTANINNAAEIAHGEIVLDHGGIDKPLQCFTCHKEDERDFLTIEDGSKVDFDHSYELCGQCHFRQKKDWVGGAHGKRIALWTGMRVVKNCTSCHDPHSPLFKARWPKTYSRPLKK